MRQNLFSRGRGVVLLALAAGTWNAASCGSAKTSAPTSSAADRAAMEGDSEAVTQSTADKAPSVPGLTDFVTATNAFAFDLYRTVYADNVVVAPHGVVGELLLVHASADGETRQQVAETLRVRSPELNLRDRYRLFLDAVSGRLAPPSAQRGFRITSATSIWHAAELSPSSTLLQTSTEHFATVHPLDFDADGLGSVNKHYDDATAGKFTTLVSGEEKGPVLIASATTFDGPWDLPFERALTEDHTFAGANGEVAVPMMHGRIRTGFFDGDGFQLLELPYADRQVSAWFLLPDEDQSGFDATLTAEHFTWMVEQTRQHEVDVRIPRFELEHRADLTGVLSTMGMPGSFAKDANLAGFTPAKGSHIGSLVHAARIKVNEDGSDAVATTRSPVTIAAKRLPTFEATRPFTVILRHAGTGAVLTLAHVANPVTP